MEYPRREANAATETIVDRYYAEHYTDVHGSGPVGAAQAVMHRCLEHRRSREAEFPVTLELGAGNLEHYPFVAHRRDRYIASDIRDPSGGELALALKRAEAPQDLTFQRADATRLPYADRSVNRIVAGCLAIHLPDLYAAVVEWQRVCSRDGVIDFLVPCDPGVVSRAFRRLVSEPAARRRGVEPVEYRLVNAIEHVSSFQRVLTLTRAALEHERSLRLNYYPLRFVPSWNLNAFAIFTICPK